MEKKLIFFDIDGTLLDEQTFTVPTSAIEAIHQAQKNGHLCFINTGRPISTIDQVILDIGMDGYICGCGTYIEYHNQEIFHVEIGESQRKGIIQKAYEFNIDAALEGKLGAFFRDDSFHYLMKDCRDRYIKEGLPVHQYNADSIVMFDKFAAGYDETGNLQAFKEYLEPEFEVIQRAHDFIEVIPSTCSKATGIERLVNYLNMSIDNTIGIGDSTNDLSMLKFTKESVAMGNSNPLLFDQVTYITKDINDDGIAHALKHFHLI